LKRAAVKRQLKLPPDRINRIKEGYIQQLICLSRNILYILSKKEKRDKTLSLVQMGLTGLRKNKVQWRSI